MASVMQILSLRGYALLLPSFKPRNPRFRSIYYKPTINFSPAGNSRHGLSIRSNVRVVPLAAVPSSHSQPLDSQSPTTRTPFLLTESTRTVTALAVLAHAAFRALAHKLSIAILNPNPRFVNAVQSSLGTVGAAFFASLRDRPAGYLNTPLTVVAAGLSKWLDIYSGVLMVRVLLSWFPNIPWERQPLSAIRDLCDPYLNLFRNIIPPVFGALDVSPLLAFAVLGCLGSILNGVV